MNKKLPAEMIDGAYRVEHPLGGGSFSDVFRVRGPSGKAALKLLRLGFGGYSDTAIADFKSEFSLLKELHHPHIASILDFGFDASLEQFYFTSELIEGSDLFAATESSSCDEILEFMVQTLRAFHYLHSYGIYHLDVKAANVLLTETDPQQIKIIDFGLASMNPEGRVAGTPSYMAPEVVKSERPDARADIYSLGVLFYYCLTRTNPFRGKGVQATLDKQLSVTPEPPSVLRPEVPDYLDTLLLKMLQKNRGDRYQRIDQILKDIQLRLPGRFSFETQETLLSYLPEEGRLIGRKQEWKEFQKIFATIFKKSKKFPVVCWVVGEMGTGKTRFLKEARYYAELNDVSVGATAEKGRPWLWLFDDLGERVSRKDEEERLRGDLARFFYGPPRKSPWSLVAACEDPAQLPDSLRSLFEEVPQHTISLQPFMESELVAYLVSLTGIDDPPQTLLRELQERTDGNPLLVTEMLRSLIQVGALFDAAGRWKKTVFEDVGVDFSQAQPSDRFEKILLERIDQLNPSGQKLIEWLAFSPLPLHADQLEEKLLFSGLSRSLAILKQRALIVRESSGGYRLKNRTLAEIVTQKRTAKESQQIHDRLASLYPSDSEEGAYHLLRGRDSEKAVAIARECGGRSLQQARIPKAVSFFQEILFRIPKEQTALRREFLLKLSEASLLQRDFERARQTCEEVTQLLAHESKGTTVVSEKVDALIRAGALALKLGELEEAEQSFQVAEKLLPQAEEASIKRLQIENFRGKILMQQGDLDRAETTFQETQKKWASSLSKKEQKEVTNNDLGMVWLARGDYTAARKRFQEDLTFYEKLQDQLLLARGHYNLAEACLGLEEFDEAITHYQQAADFASAIKNLELLLRAYNGLGNAAQLAQRWEESIAYYERGLPLAERMGDLTSAAAIRINMGLIYSQQEKIQEAIDHLEPAIHFLRQQKQKSPFEWQTLCRALLERGELARRASDWEEAKRSLAEAQQISEQRGGVLASWIKNALNELGNARDVKAQANQRKRIESPRETLMKNPYLYILQINKYINAEADLSFVLKSVLNYALELCGAETGLILLLNETGDLQAQAAVNTDPDESRVAFSRTIAEQAIQTGELIQTRDAETDERFSSEASVASLRLKSVLCLPVRSKEKTIGALYLENSHQQGAFADLDLEVLHAFTDQVGIAIENARSLEASEQSQRFLEKRVEEISSERNRYQALAARLPDGKGTKYEQGGIIGQAKGMQEIFILLDKITDTDLSVYIHGESGTGKELVARALHDHSARREASFVALNCGAIPENLLESELFGVKAGAFTGATRDRKGLVEEAKGGTLFLDEISELQPPLQVKLLRLLQEGEYRRVGETTTRQAQIRFVAASNQDLEALVKKEGFREDLFYRLCQIRIDLPPLRERTEDIPLLVNHFLAKEKRGKKLKVARSLMKNLLDYSWPGNIRELENILKVASALAEKGMIDASAVPANHGLSRFLRGVSSYEGYEPTLKPEDESDKTKAQALGPAVPIDEQNQYDPSKNWYDYEHRIVAQALLANNFKVKETAQMLGLATTTLYKKMREWKLKDASHPLVQERFIYTKGKTLKDYLSAIFQAAFRAADEKAYTAIAQLKVSPGYFYKVMKGITRQDQW